MKNLNISNLGDQLLTTYFENLGRKVFVNKNELTFGQGIALSTVATNHIYLWGVARGLKEIKIEKPGRVLEIVFNSISDMNELEGFSHIVTDKFMMGIEIFRLTNLGKKLIAERLTETKNGIITISSFEERK